MHCVWPIREGWVVGSGWMPIWLTNADQFRSVPPEPGCQSNPSQSARVTCGTSVKSMFWIWSLRPGCSQVSWDLWNGAICLRGWCYVIRMGTQQKAFGWRPTCCMSMPYVWLRSMILFVNKYMGKLHRSNAHTEMPIAEMPISAHRVLGIILFLIMFMCSVLVFQRCGCAMISHEIFQPDIAECTCKANHVVTPNRMPSINH